jgi:hypothetical protein
MMGGAIDWAALPLVAEVIGAYDVEALVRGLIQIRDHMKSKAD